MDRTDTGAASGPSSSSGTFTRRPSRVTATATGRRSCPLNKPMCPAAPARLATIATSGRSVAGIEATSNSAQLGSEAPGVLASAATVVFALPRGVAAGQPAAGWLPGTASRSRCAARTRHARAVFIPGPWPARSAGGASWPCHRRVAQRPMRLVSLTPRAPRLVSALLLARPVTGSGPPGGPMHGPGVRQRAE
jgi:hypothetical protein